MELTKAQRKLLVKRVYELLVGCPNLWTQHAWGRDREGNYAHPDGADKWSLYGAVKAATRGPNKRGPAEIPVEASYQFFREELGADLQEWNDRPETDYFAVETFLREMYRRHCR